MTVSFSVKPSGAGGAGRSLQAAHILSRAAGLPLFEQAGKRGQVVAHIVPQAAHLFLLTPDALVVQLAHIRELMFLLKRLVP